MSHSHPKRILLENFADDFLRLNNELNEQMVEFYSLLKDDKKLYYHICMVMCETFKHVHLQPFEIINFASGGTHDAQWEKIDNLPKLCSLLAIDYDKISENAAPLKKIYDKCRKIMGEIFDIYNAAHRIA